jgi:hypothetical protein
MIRWGWGGRKITHSDAVLNQFYYSRDWQVAEERDAAYSPTVIARNVWSLACVDALVLRDQDSDIPGTLDQRLYVMQDANSNVTGIVDTSGTVAKRYRYDPYGTQAILDGSWGSRGSTLYEWKQGHQGGSSIAQRRSSTSGTGNSAPARADGPAPTRPGMWMGRICINMCGAIRWDWWIRAGCMEGHSGVEFPGLLRQPAVTVARRCSGYIRQRRFRQNERDSITSGHTIHTQI